MAAKMILDAAMAGKLTVDRGPSTVPSASGVCCQLEQRWWRSRSLFPKHDPHCCTALLITKIDKVKPKLHCESDVGRKALAVAKIQAQTSDFQNTPRSARTCSDHRRAVLMALVAAPGAIPFSRRPPSARTRPKEYTIKGVTHMLALCSVMDENDFTY